MTPALMAGFSQKFISVDAVTNAQRHAQEYGVGFIRVERDGSMKAIDPRSVILK